MSEFVDIAETYQGVRTAISSALNGLDGISVDNEEGNKHLADVRKTLSEMEATFNKEIAYLEKHADWQNFTVAFFGETNAGKSTIIESLRIIMNEQARASLLRANASDVAASEAKFAREAEDLIHDLQGAYEDYRSRLSDLAAQIRDLEMSSQQAMDGARKGVKQAEHQAMLITQELAVAQKETARAIHDTALALKLAAKRLWLGLGAGFFVGAAACAAARVLFF